MTSTTLFVGVMLSENTMVHGCEAALQLALNDVPDRSVVVQRYPTVNPATVPANADQFLADSAQYPFRTIITESSTLMLAFDRYLNQGQPYSLSLLILDVSASANALTELLSDNAMTYAYFNQYMVASFYMLVRTYRMKRVVVVVDRTEGQYSLFVQDLMEQLERQAELLNIPYQSVLLTETFSIRLMPQTGFYFLVSDDVLNQFLSRHPSYINQFPSSSFVMLSDIANETKDLFGNVPAFVAVPWPLDYTQTSLYLFESIVGDNLQDYLNGTRFMVYEVYAMYQIMYCHAMNTTFSIMWTQPYSLSAYMSYNSFQGIPPPWLYASAFDEEKKGPRYGLFHCVLTKNALYVGEKEQIAFKRHFRGGIPLLPNSYSSLFRIGRTGYDVTEVWIDRNVVWHFIDSAGCLRIARNSFDFTRPFKKETEQQTFLSQNELRDIEVLYRYSDSSHHFFSFLEILPPLSLCCQPDDSCCACKRYIVKQTMYVNARMSVPLELRLFE